jgi:hypothetical protein
MVGLYGLEEYYIQLLFVLKTKPALRIGNAKIETLDAYWRGCQHAMQIAYEKNWSKGMQYYMPFSCYCLSIVGVDEKELVSFLKNKYIYDEDAEYDDKNRKAAFKEYLEYIEDYLMKYRRDRRIIHKFKRTKSKSAFLKNIRKLMADNPSIRVEHLILKVEKADTDDDLFYTGYIKEYQLDPKIELENTMIQETKMILGDIDKR